MTESNKNQLTQKVEELYSLSMGQLRSNILLRWIGYGLLVLILFDLIEIFISPNFLNPTWQFQTLGQLVERVPVPLIGFAFVFYGEKNGRYKWEPPVLKFLSWITLLSAVLFFLLIPLGIVNTVRIDRNNNAQITAQLDGQVNQIKQAKQALSEVSTEADMQAFLSKINSSAPAPNIQDSQQLEQMKQQVSKVIIGRENRLVEQANATRSSQRLRLLKTSVKWNLGALISAALFLTIWVGTRWVRR